MGDRFWSKVERRGNDECWRWTAQRSPLGYGVFWLNGKNAQAHRVAWEETHGAIPEGLVVRHKCRGRCVNPNHLELGTRADNQHDRIRDGTSNRGERHGHSKLTEDQVRQIKGVDPTRTNTSIAMEYGVSRETIGLIRRGKRWGWLSVTSSTPRPPMTIRTPEQSMLPNAPSQLSFPASPQ